MPVFFSTVLKAINIVRGSIWETGNRKDAGTRTNSWVLTRQITGNYFTRVKIEQLY